MVQIEKIVKVSNTEPRESFNLIPAIITLVLMTLFVVSTIYVLISSLL